MGMEVAAVELDHEAMRGPVAVNEEAGDKDIGNGLRKALLVEERRPGLRAMHARIAPRSNGSRRSASSAIDSSRW